MRGLSLVHQLSFDVSVEFRLFRAKAMRVRISKLYYTEMSINSASENLKTGLFGAKLRWICVVIWLVQMFGVSWITSGGYRLQRGAFRLGPKLWVVRYRTTMFCISSPSNHSMWPDCWSSGDMMTEIDLSKNNLDLFLFIWFVQIYLSQTRQRMGHLMWISSDPCSSSIQPDHRSELMRSAVVFDFLATTEYTNWSWFVPYRGILFHWVFQVVRQFVFLSVIFVFEIYSLPKFDMNRTRRTRVLHPCRSSASTFVCRGHYDRRGGRKALREKSTRAFIVWWAIYPSIIVLFSSG